MLIKTGAYLIFILLCIFSIYIFIRSIINKKRIVCIYMIISAFLCLLYCFLNFVILNSLYIPFGFEVLIIYFGAVVTGSLSISSLIVNFIKRIKAKKVKDNKKICLVPIIVFIVPILIFVPCYIRSIILIKNSELLLIYTSRGNGGIGDYQDFAYAVSKDSCKQFDLGIDIPKYGLKKYLPEGYVHKYNLDDTEYRVINDEMKKTIEVYKNDELICSDKYNKDYYNNDIEDAYILK